MTGRNPGRRRPRSTPQFRLATRSRAGRRALARGGEGMAERLNATAGGWLGVRITPMFGRWGYFVEGRLFGCFPVHPKAHDLWIRLSRDDQARALRTGGVRPHRRFAARGWVECDVTDLAALGLALRWLRRGWAATRAGAIIDPSPETPPPRFRPAGPRGAADSAPDVPRG